MFDRALHECVVLPDVNIETGPSLRNEASLGIREHDHVHGLVPAVVAVIEKSLPIAGGSRSARVKIGITGI